jgi:hypothetical protein
MSWAIIIFFLLALFGLLHQGLFCNEWWNWGQFWHHETLIAICVALGSWELLRKLVRR